jgi:RimJ/RimL family protein N-acetyltransferase
MKLAPVRLSGERIELLPLDADLAPALWKASVGSGVWRYMPMWIDSEQQMDRFVAEACGRAALGSGVGFAVRHRECDEIVGATGLWDHSEQHRRVEIGATWLAPSHQRTAVNGEAKLLLLEHAFERLGCLRVEFKTDSRNQQSRAALERIGAREEGTLRAHMILPDGSRRDSVYFSILAEEWPGVRERLATRLAARGR